MTQPLPLVSIILITYNSGDYILETLDSFKAQTYQNLELIIADDGSTDATLQICDCWLRLHESVFKRTVLIPHSVNTGTASNLNRGIRQARGEWYKIVAGDDMLYPECIAAYIAKVTAQPEIEFIFSEIQINGKLQNQKLHNQFFCPHVNQYRILLKNNFLSSPTAFIRNHVFEKVGLFDERYQLFEDYPFFLKSLKAGIRFHLLHKTLVYYRIHPANISNAQKFNHPYLKDIVSFFHEGLLPELIRQRLFFYYVHYSIQLLYLKLITNGFIKKATTYQFVLKWTGPLFWKLRLQNLLNIS
ncbi:MAG: glycosyltransferase [Bacteroidetes bacterium]|nr:glycosyltransferase [Bacteroidota bacterium]